ncbi:MAG: amino acid ABC transporter permease [Clostridiaceae bacterium]|jgi:cystine transport system permease protein|nr:amino acid ABC transporter permease [Clostridiaceae bacterium]
MPDRMVRIVQILTDSFFPLLKAGIQFTVPLTILSFTLGVAIAFTTAIVRVLEIKPFAGIARFYIWIVRGTPLLVQLFIIFYGLPSIGITLNALISAVIGFSLSVGAYSSEIIRAAILSISKGQWEASYALGMPKVKTLSYVILPQAIKVAIPPLSNSFISLVKDTSLAATITVSEMFQVAQQITARTYEPLWLYTEAAVIYLVFCSGLTVLQSRMETRFGRHLAG